MGQWATITIPLVAATMETDSDLTALVQRNDHLNVLRYIRVHQLREPGLVVDHGKKLLGPNLSNPISNNDLARLSALEQICLAALDSGEPETAELCVKQIKEAGITDGSIRFRRILARCLEATQDYSGAEIIYDELLKENPANLVALKRKFCVLKAQPGKLAQLAQALNRYLEQNYSDSAAWYEMSELRMELGDYEGAAFALEEVILGSPADAKLHLMLAECYATIGDVDHLLLARKHCAQALELDPGMKRAHFSLIAIINSFLLSTKNSKETDAHDLEVAQELLRYGANQLKELYAGSDLLAPVTDLMNQFTESL
jgi:tetratricopeptide (TPR) repeat protein